MRLFSKASRYAIRAMMHVLETESLPRFSARKICAGAEIPEPFARKALQEMAKEGIIQGVPGPGGGYSLTRKLSEITLLDIVLAVDGQNAFSECPMGLRCRANLAGEEFQSCENCSLMEPKCGLSHLCPMHDLWKKSRMLIIHDLERTTLQAIKEKIIQ